MVPQKRTKIKNDKIVTLKENNKTIKFRIIKYVIDGNIYYLGTTIYGEDICIHNFIFIIS